MTESVMPSARKAAGKPATPKEVWRAGVYECPLCQNRIAVLVDMTAPPVCWNHKSHKIVEMNRRKK